MQLDSSDVRQTRARFSDAGRGAIVVVTEWHSGEGHDVEVSDDDGRNVRRFGVSHAECDAMTATLLAARVSPPRE